MYEKVTSFTIMVNVITKVLSVYGLSNTTVNELAPDSTNSVYMGAVFITEQAYTAGQLKIR